MEEQGNQDINTTLKSETGKISKLENFKIRIKQKFSKLKEYIKTHKKQSIVISVLFVSLLITLIVFLISNNKPQTEIKVAENIAEEEVTTKYDYIYNPSDTTLTASTLSGDRTLELINSDGIILDYVVSPNKEKIAYVLAPKDYKNKITSTNVDVSKFKFQPVGFEIYELNLKTGQNTKLWTRDLIKLGATQQEVYYKKQIIFPDSYAVGYHYNTVLSYPVDGEPFYETVATPFSYPVSYVQVVDDVQRGYMYEDLPWDLNQELIYKIVSIVGYNEDSTKLAVVKDNLVSVFEDSKEKNYDMNLGKCFSPITANKKFIGNLIVLDNLGCSDYSQSGSKAFKIEGNNLNDIFRQFNTGNTRNVPKYIDNDFSLTVSYPVYYRGDDYINEMIFLDLSNFNGKTLKSFDNYSTLREVTASLPTVAVTTATSKNYASPNIYTFSQYSKEGTFKDLGEIELPSDIGDLYYDYETNNISFYRKYVANSETIIEYRIINLESKEEKEIKTIKVKNDSVLYYKPKLVWLKI